ncbi:MAG: sodium/proline symporter PutP [Deltaproteobacteria bacterium]|nr:sodium/proline symporter PutP [Deltaproteobacteria bacterium]
MQQNTAIISAFAIYLLSMMGIGVYAWLRTRNLADYILGGRKLGPVVTALSAGASDMSGWLMLGLPGLSYTSGLGSIWIACGLLAGTWGNWRLMARRLRTFSLRAGDALTLPVYLENRFDDRSHLLRVLSALVILVFFTIYTASGLIAGGKLFEEVFGLPYETAVLIGMLSVVVYTLFGGFLAVSLTDVIQGLLMSLALLLVPIYSLFFHDNGGLSHSFEIIRSAGNGTFLNIFSDKSGAHYSWIAILSFLGWGLGYMGQPHILARFKAIRNPDEIPAARRLAIIWTTCCLLGAIAVGLSGLVTLSATPDDPERVFILLVNSIFHPIPAGILLAAILAAIMSTADSQLLVASSALTEDFCGIFIHKKLKAKTLVHLGRISVILISMISTLLALGPERAVLDVTAFAWAGFGAAFGPPLLISLYWRKMSAAGALAGILSGSITVVVWHYMEGGVFGLYEIIPGTAISALSVIFVSLLTKAGQKAELIFDQSLADLHPRQPF